MTKIQLDMTTFVRNPIQISQNVLEIQVKLHSIRKVLEIQMALMQVNVPEIEVVLQRNVLEIIQIASQKSKIFPLDSFRECTGNPGVY